MEGWRDKMKIFVSGSEGFVGKNLLQRIGKTHKVIECEVDITMGQPFTLMNDMFGCDAVVHLAAMTKANESLKRPHIYLKTNLMGTINILEAMRLSGVKRLIYISSCGVKDYSQGSPYLWAKHLSERACAMYSKLYGLEIVILRPTNIYGPHNWKGVIHRFLEAKKNGEPLEIYGNGTQTRDFIYVCDVCDSIIKAIDIKFKDILYIEIGTGKETTIKELAKIIGGIYKFIPLQNIGLKQSVADTTKAKTILGFEAKIALEEGLRRLQSI